MPTAREEYGVVTHAGWNRSDSPAALSLALAATVVVASIIGKPPADMVGGM
jgi:hypothetical protein